MTLLKPISAAIATGTGGPFGAEGPSSQPVEQWDRLLARLFM